MPVSARLSHRLHDALGEEAGGDLVTWMQTVDANRSELRDLVEMYAARTDSRFGEFEARMDARFAEAQARMDTRFAQVDTRLAQLEARMERQYARVLSWSFGFWATTLVALYAFTCAPR